VERAVGVIVRAEVAKQRVRLPRELLVEAADNAGLADARLTREQYYLPFALLRSLPAVEQ